MNQQTTSRSFLAVRFLLVPLFVSCCLCTGLLHAQVTFDWATVGNPGNTPDQDYGSGQFGAVDYTYRISKHEVTNDQYAEFLNAAAATDSFPGADPNLYNSSMDITQSGNSGSFTYAVNAAFGPNPVNFVSFFDSMRFVNWLENGQGSGGTESGVYTIGTGLDETRAASATFFIPSEDEWYKAAYHQPAAQGGPADDYWFYPTQSDTAPSCVAPPGAANSANCDNAVGDTTDVGAYTNTTNFYGTFDQGGNVFEWNEAVISSSFRGVRGADWSDGPRSPAASDRINCCVPTWEEFSTIGFRVASIPVPDADFNDDGVIDCTDVDSLVAEIVAGTDNQLFDLTGDSVVDTADLDQWRVQGGAANHPSGNAYLEADATLDGVVDGLDFVEWNLNKFTSVAAWCSGDFTADGTVDEQDFALWNENKFMSSDGVSAVPEPRIGVLMITALIGLAVAGQALTNSNMKEMDHDEAEICTDHRLCCPNFTFGDGGTPSRKFPGSRGSARRRFL